MRSIRCACALLLCSWLLLSAGARAHAQGPVGFWGDPQRIVITGSRQWPAEEIRRELIADLDAVIASHPASPLADFPQLLATRVRDGYLQGGFALATAAVRLDPLTQQVLVTIDEGPRYFAGDIKVHGPPGTDAAHIAAWLTAPQPARGARLTGFINGNESLPRWVDKNNQRIIPEKPVWTPGKPARFHAGTPDEYTTAVQRALEQQGYPQATLEVAVLRDDVHRMATLQIIVKDLGRRYTIDRVEVTGNKRDTADDVLRYLGVRQGQVVTESYCAAWRHKLWLSGRYLEQTVWIEPAKVPGDSIGLKIQLVDSPSAPPISEPLTQDEQLVLQCREWVMKAIDRGDALVMRGATESMRLEFVSVQDQGTLCVLEPIKPAAGAKPKEASELTTSTLFAGLPGELLHIVGDQSQLLRAQTNQGQFVINIDLQSNLDPKDTKHKFALKIGAGYKSNSRMQMQEPVAVSLSIAPAALLSFIRDPHTEHTLEGGVLVVKARGATCRIEVATGRLLEFVVQSDKRGPRFTISVESGTFGEYLAAAERKMGIDPQQTPNAFRNDHPVSSTIEFLLASPLTELGLDLYDNQKRLSGDLVEGVRALNKLIAGDAFWPIDQCACKAHSPTDNDFCIPGNESSLLESSGDGSVTGGAMMGIALVMLQHADNIFPRESWPWTISRDIALSKLKQSRFVDADLGKLRGSSAMGPVGHLMTATLLTQNNPEAAVRFAQRGVELLSLEHFRADYRPFLDNTKSAGQILQRSAELMTEFTDDEADELGRLLLGREHRLMVTAVRYLREHKSEPIERVLPGMLDHLWEHGLAKAVKTRLQGVQSQNQKLAKVKQKQAEQVARAKSKRPEAVATRPSRRL